MDKDFKMFLEHILESINYIQEFTKGKTKKDFNSSIQMQDAIIRRIEIIGEATKNLPENFKMNTPYIPWRKMAGMRDNLIHEYFGIDKVEVWKTVKDDIPILKREISELLNKLTKI
jgi:uncharacterized protein with HEPN domain